MKILITGASGYVGSALAQDLRGKHEIIATARDPKRITLDGVQKLALDISSPEQVRQTIESVKPDIVIHAAALPKRSTADDDTFIRTNVEGIRNVAEATQKHSKAKFIMISSGCAFKQKPGEVITSDSEREMGNAFSLSKNLAEDAVTSAFAGDENRLAIVYPPVILHASQEKGIIPYALQDAQNSGVITNKVPGGHVNFITHEKFAELVDAIAQDKHSKGVQRYPITGNRFTTHDFFEKLQTTFQNNFHIPCRINTQADPHIETMCAMDETAIKRLNPDFEWGNIDTNIRDIVKKHTGKDRVTMNTDDRAEQVAELIGKLYPGEDKKTVFAGPVAKAVLGALPPYSNRDDYHLYSCTTITAGAFVAAHAQDTSRRDPATGRMGEPVVVMIERSEKDASGEPKVGLLGGFTNLDYVVKNGVKDTSRGEQPNEGALREFGEELIGADGKPVVTPDIARLTPLISGIDYRRKISPACAYTGFGLELTPEELETIKTHAQRMHDDPTYTDAVSKASGGEVTKVMVKPLSEAIAMPREQFTHPHEFDAIVKLAEQLKQQQAVISRL
jgi:nucleoside-diphosphate-sugar epimerase